MKFKLINENLKLTKDYNSLLDKFNKLNRKNQQIMHDLNKEIEVNDKLHQELKIKRKQIKNYKS